MIQIVKKIFFIVLVCWCCSTNRRDTEPITDDELIPILPENEQNTISAFEYIDEFVLSDQEIGGIPIGGFSGIDYQNDKWYIICDTSIPPIRYYEADITYTKEGFTSVGITAMVEIKDDTGISLVQGVVDPEAIRYDSDTGTIIYTSEGSISNGVDPALIEITPEGNQIKRFTLPDNFKVNTMDTSSGSRHNGTLEGLSLDFENKGYWISFELPLIEDGPEPTTTDTQSPVRVTYINKTSGIAERQFTYELDPVARKATLGTTFEANGLVEILEYDTNKFLALERSFSSGYIDGGNTVKIYKVDATNATNTLSTETLATTSYTAATKTLLFTFDSIRSQLTNNTVDNLEGFSFGPKLKDGSRTIVVISDNNFNSFFPQLNQFIVLKVVP
jgi:hypothetical protein